LSRPTPIRSSTPRFSSSARALLCGIVAASLALALLTARVFVPQEALDVVALLLLGVGLVAVWVAVLAWRMPVFERRHLAALASLWGVGVALSAGLVLLATDGERTLLWRRSVEWLALTLSLAVGALFLRALLRVRTSPRTVRLLSLISPFAILGMILLLASLKT
jgi:hypothetical protein